MKYWKGGLDGTVNMFAIGARQLGQFLSCALIWQTKAPHQKTDFYRTLF